jgi:hypothetical protein
LCKGVFDDSMRASLSSGRQEALESHRGLQLPVSATDMPNALVILLAR